MGYIVRTRPGIDVPGQGQDTPPLKGCPASRNSSCYTMPVGHQGRYPSRPRRGQDRRNREEQRQNTCKYLRLPMSDSRANPSLTLSLASESKTEDGECGTTSSDRERYVAHDAIAVQGLEGLSNPFARRGELPKAVVGAMEPELREDDSNALKKALRAYSGHQTRLSKPHFLWPYIDQKNDKGDRLTFRNPKHRGRRAAKPSRRKTLSYSIPNQERGGLIDAIDSVRKSHVTLDVDIERWWAVVTSRSHRGQSGDRRAPTRFGG